MVALLVILTFIGLILIDGVVQWSRHRAELAGAGAPGHPGGVLEALPWDVSIPSGLFLSSGHTWLGLLKRGTVRVGMDSLVQGVLHRIDEVKVPMPGQRVAKGQELFRIRAGEKTLSFASPIDAVVESTNDQLARDPERMIASPYGRGWVCTLQPRTLARSLRQLFINEEARQFLRFEGKRLTEFFTSNWASNDALGSVAPDGGQISKGALSHCNQETWRKFSDEFLSERAHY